MTDSTRGAGAAGPPWSVDVLADLHAGALDPKQSAVLWERVNRDPEAQAVLAALEDVRRDLDALGDAPPEPMPAHFAAQLDAALAAEAGKSRPGVAPVVDMASARRKRNRRLGWAAGVLTAAAAAVAVTFVALPGQQQGNPTAGDAAQQTPRLTMAPSDPGAAISGLQGQEDFGPLEDEAGLKDCLAEHGIDDPQVIGAREVAINGANGVAALLAGGEDGKRFRLVVVSPNCAEKITDTSLG